MDQSLSHYGIKGMKWGVRRYRNYDGSYTKRGVARYDEAQKKYDLQKEKVDATKTAVKIGGATKKELRAARKQLRAQKKNVQKEYGKLKQEKLADEGKALYKKGKTITGNYTVESGLVTAAGIGAFAAKNFITDQRIGNLSASAIAVGGTVVSGILAGKHYRENKRLRAYYAH